MQLRSQYGHHNDWCDKEEEGSSDKGIIEDTLVGIIASKKLKGMSEEELTAELENREIDRTWPFGRYGIDMEQYAVYEYR